MHSLNYGIFVARRLWLENDNRRMKNKFHDTATNHHTTYFLFLEGVLTNKGGNILGQGKQRATKQIRLKSERDMSLSFSSVDPAKQIIIHSAAVLCHSPIS
jgi:hypothetical protein